MATLYLAEDLKHERKVALEALNPQLAAVVGVAFMVSLSILGCGSAAAGPTDSDTPTPVATTLTLSASELSFSSLGATEQEFSVGGSMFSGGQYNHVVWTEPNELREKLKYRILAVVPAATKG